MGKKSTARDILDNDLPLCEPGTQQRYARVLGPRGNHQHEVEFTDGSRTLVTLQPKFRNLVWVKRGHFVIVDPSVGTTSEKVGGEIINVLFPKHIKALEQAGHWPSEFSVKKKHQQEQDQDDLLFVNNNRPVMSETESGSSDDDDEEEEEEDED